MNNEVTNNKKDGNVLIYILAMFISSVLSFIIFVTLFHTPLFSGVKVFMYRGIALLLCSAIFNIILLIILRKTIFKDINVKDIFSIILVYLSVVMMFFTLVPVTVERSVSVHMLFNMERAGGFTKDDMQNNFIDNYVIKNDAFGKRIIEQEVTGSIKLDESDNKYKLTEKGKTLVILFDFIGKMFNADMKLMQ